MTLRQTARFLAFIWYRERNPRTSTQACGDWGTRHWQEFASLVSGEMLKDSEEGRRDFGAAVERLKTFSVFDADQCDFQLKIE
jgi:hypothetical protein